VVRVRARQNGCVAAASSEICESVVQLALAVVAAIGAVAAVAVARELGRRDRLVADADRLGDPAGAPVASAGETAVTASARSPSARAARQATSDESTPPEKATMLLPRRRMRRS